MKTALYCCFGYILIALPLILIVLGTRLGVILGIVGEEENSRRDHDGNYERL